MRTKELSRTISEKTGIKATDVTIVLKAFTEVVTDEMKNGEKVQIDRFGTFEASERAERTTKNPLTNKMITVAAHKAPKFKASKILKDEIN